MAVEKISISLPAGMTDSVREAAGRAGLSVSSWFADAAAASLRHQALGEFLDSYEAEHGAFTPGEIAEAERRLGIGAAVESAA